MPAITIDGVICDGWRFDENGNGGLSTCGLGILSRIKRAEIKAKPEAILQNILRKNQYRGDEYGESKLQKLSKEPEGNLLFTINSQDLKTSSGFLSFLLEHPATRIIHAYKNNAHGPNCIYICMFHLFPDEVEQKGWVNNVKEYRAKMKWKDYEWHVE